MMENIIIITNDENIKKNDFKEIYGLLNNHYNILIVSGDIITEVNHNNIYYYDFSTLFPNNNKNLSIEELSILIKSHKLSNTISDFLSTNKIKKIALFVSDKISLVFSYLAKNANINTYNIYPGTRTCDNSQENICKTYLDLLCKYQIIRDGKLLNNLISKNIDNYYVANNNNDVKDIIMGYINVVYCAGNNLGDQLNYYILKKLNVNYNEQCFSYYKSDLFRDNDHILFCGSLLAVSNNKSHIMGAGVIRDNLVFDFKKIYFLRGPLSRKNALRNCEEKYVPDIYGDPAMLLPLLHEPKKGTTIIKKYLFIPHKIDIKEYISLNLRNCDILRIDVNYKKTEDFINILNNYDYIITSSLHGLILSYAYGKHTYVVKSKNILSGDNIKFYDFLHSVDVYNFKLDKSFDNFLDGDQLLIDNEFFIVPNNNKTKLLQKNIVQRLPFYIPKRRLLLDKIYDDIKNYTIIIETFILKDGEYREQIIDERFDIFINNTYKSLIDQKYKNFYWVLYIENENEHLVDKIKKFPFEKNIVLHYYNSSIYHQKFPDLNSKNMNDEGFVRGNRNIRSELCKLSTSSIVEKYNKKYIVNLALDDDDVLEDTHLEDINFYSNIYGSDDNVTQVKIKNMYINYVKDNTKINILSKRIPTGNKFIISNNYPSTYTSGYNITEYVNSGYLIEKPKSTFVYMRYNNSHLSGYNKNWLIEKVIDN